MSSDRYALLFRLNPKHWPVWEQRIPLVPEQWFPTGRRVTDGITSGIPAIILGTGRIGIVGGGETTSGVEFRADPYAHESGPGYEDQYARPANRVRVRIELRRVPVEIVQGAPAADHLRRTRRETTTWLSTSDFHALKHLMDTRAR